ncbi:DgyrCDS11114 [Dimorphilus gyrociliatus]|uniref:DgyrCDS11114 n=1 Tax=Dimorphilus gyrociliatus TaxID=2664684 RepID=A0A7I8W2A9_9ANNE|nr:DgyrCDS11114 [Dimorphilus gyrociliatus]
MCKIVKFSQGFIMHASSFLLISLSIDRRDAIVEPMKFSSSIKRAKILVCVAWVLAAVFATPYTILYNETKVSHEGKNVTTCKNTFFTKPWHWKFWFSLSMTIVFYLPIVIILCCYAQIIYAIWRKSTILLGNRRNFTETCNLPCQRGTSVSSRGIIPRAKIRTIKMTFLIVLVFMLCWSPYLIINHLNIYGVLLDNYRPLIILVNSMCYFNSVANPIIYGVYSSKICQNFSTWLPICNRCASRTDSTNRRLSSTYYKSFESTRLSTTRKEAILMKKINEDE